MQYGTRNTASPFQKMEYKIATAKERERFMFKKSKSAFILMAVAVFVSFFAFPTAAQASVGNVAAVTGLTVTSTNVKVGDTVTITVTTTAAANNVLAYATVEGIQNSGRLDGTDAAGNKTWSVFVAPTKSQNVDIYVSATADLSNAAKLSIPFTVADEVVVPPVATPAPNTVTIGDITETSAGKSVTLSFSTSTDANNVWVEYDNQRYTQGKLASQNDTSKNWTIVFNPTGPQTVIVSANTAYKTNNATNVPYNVIFTASIAPPAVATINSASASPSSIAYNSYTDITVRTNADTDYVWAEYDSTEASANIVSQSSATITWRVRVYPSRSQTIRVYANTADGTDGSEATRNVTVTVRDQYTNRATIDSASASWNNYQVSGYGNLTVNVTTNSYANYVWFNYNGQVYQMSRSGSYSNQWTYTSSSIYWNQSSSLTVYASEQSYSDSYAVSRGVTIQNNYQQGYIQSFYALSNTVKVGGTIQFKVITSSAVSVLGIYLNNNQYVTSSSYSYPYSQNQSLKEWDITIPASTVGTFTYYVYPDNQYQLYQSGYAPVTVTVQQ
jgi:hypothetical protein